MANTARRCAKLSDDGRGAMAGPKKGRGRGETAPLGSAGTEADSVEGSGAAEDARAPSPSPAPPLLLLLLMMIILWQHSMEGRETAK